MNVKKIIAKEGLILLGIGLILYFSFSFLCQNIPAVFPKYKVEFMNGQVYTIDIYPDYYFSKDMKKFIKELYNPRSETIEKRLNEFIKRENISSPLKEAKLINSQQLYLSQRLISFLSFNLFIKIVVVYFILLLIRFLIWAIKALREK